MRGAVQQARDYNPKQLIVTLSSAKRRAPPKKLRVTLKILNPEPTSHVLKFNPPQLDPNLLRH
jgi:hypothetical protein